MTTNNEGLYLIKKFEGLRLQAYKPVTTEKFFTIGYGHYGPDVKEKTTITEEQAEDLLKKDLAKFEAEVKRVYKGVRLNENQFSALVSLAYNAGVGAVSKSLLSLIKSGSNSVFSWWCNHYITAGGIKLNGLIRRRKAEAELFIKKVTI